MENKIGLIKLFNKERKKINNNLLVVGSGRWAKEIINEINTFFPNIKKIYILTKNSEQLKSWASPQVLKKINLLSELKETNNIDCNYAIIANKNEKHFKFGEYLIRQSFNVLIEKPLFLKKKEFNKINTIAKKNNLKLLLSMQYLFAFYFIYLNEKLKKKKIKKVKFFWQDKNKEMRNNLHKSHDLNINFSVDIFFHIYSILICLGITRQFSYFDKINHIENFEIIKFGNKNTELEIESSRKSKVRKRLIKIIFKDGTRMELDFSKDFNFKSKIDNKPIKIPKKYLDNTLKYQIYFFLRKKQSGINKDNNEIKKLNSLFNYVNIINKKNEKNINLHSSSK